jgi:hypothetical protein
LSLSAVSWANPVGARNATCIFPGWGPGMGQISELPAVNSALALQVCPVGTAASEMRPYRALGKDSRLNRDPKEARTVATVDTEDVFNG